MPSHSITRAEAIALTNRYRSEKENILKTEYQSSGILLISETFDREDFETLLDQDGCIKIRTYLGMDENLNLCLINVGVDENDDDMLPTGTLEVEVNHIMENAIRCPPTCPPTSALNSD